MNKQKLNQRSTASKSGAIFPGISHSRLMNNSNSKTRRDYNSKSRSRSPPNRGGMRMRTGQRAGTRTGWNATRDDVEGLLDDRN